MITTLLAKPLVKVKTVLRGCVFFGLTTLGVTGWPVDNLEIVFSKNKPETRDVLLREPVLLGQEVTNTIIHSVQLTPVTDVYRVQEGRIWTWREKIMSHNAGLPSLKPERGRFAYDAPWMIVEGDSVAHERIYYRVGNERFGKNVVCVHSRPCLELWREFPDMRLALEVRRRPL